MLLYLGNLVHCFIVHQFITGKFPLRWDEKRIFTWNFEWYGNRFRTIWVIHNTQFASWERHEPQHKYSWLFPRGQILKFWSARGNKKHWNLRGASVQRDLHHTWLLLPLDGLELLWGPWFHFQGALLSRTGSGLTQNLSLGFLPRMGSHHSHQLSWKLLKMTLWWI